MTMEVPKPFTPDLRNYGQEILDRLNGQDAALREMVEWAKETTQLQAMQTQQIADQQRLIDSLARALEALQPRG